MTSRFFNGFSGAALAAGLYSPSIALAQGAENHSQDGGLGLLPAASGIAEEVHFFHNIILMPIITGISLLVLALLLYVFFRFRAKANPVASKFSHNTLIEVVWTGLPILILLVISLFSFDLLFKEDVIPDGKQRIAEGDGATTTFPFPNDFASERRRVTRPEHLQVFVAEGDVTRRLVRADYSLKGLGAPEVQVALNEAPPAGSTVIIQGGRSLVGMGARREVALAPSVTLKVSGYQWGWTYAYPDFGDFEFTSNMLELKDTTLDLYRLAVDNRVVVPVGETIRVTTTAKDVIHSWAMPNFAIKIDAVPGRINETWFKADREGIFYGQCSEICGVKHSGMPIAVEVVSRAAFQVWVDAQRQLAGMAPLFSATPVASAEPAPAPVVVAAASPTAEEVAATVTRCQVDLNALMTTDTINFRSGGAEIEDASHAFLDSIAGVAKGCSGAFIRVGGHTDSSGDEAKNVDLSKARADAVAAYLAGAGVSPDHLSAAGFGSSLPVADNAASDGRARNRRIEFTVAASQSE